MHFMETAPLNLTVRIGCRQTYEAKDPTAALFMIKPRRDEAQSVCQERFSFSPSLSGVEYQDEHDNIVYRVVLPPGATTIEHDALVVVSSRPDNDGITPHFVPLSKVPRSVLRYTLPSRYCDADNVIEFAKDLFGKIPPSVDLVQAICDWVHAKIEYRTGSGLSNISASQILDRGYGVCRDFAHVAITLCRAFDLPTRYVTGHLPDIGRLDPGTPMDFHAYFEAYLGEWLTFDARFNVPRIGRIKVAHGLDAVDGAIATLYGEAPLKDFAVWAYQVNPEEVSVGDPIDLSKRLDGVLEVRSV
jgi:transglutaminase-like putative cysteine protease